MPADNPSRSEIFGNFETLSARLDDLDTHVVSQNGFGTGVFRVQAFTTEETDTSAPWPDSDFAGWGDKVFIPAASTQGTAGIYTIQQNGSLGDFFDVFAFEGSVVWSERRYTPTASATDNKYWNQYGPWLHGLNDGDITLLAGPGLGGRSGSTYIEVQPESNDVVLLPDGREVYIMDDAAGLDGGTVTLPQACSTDNAASEFYVQYFPGSVPATEPAFVVPGANDPADGLTWVGTDRPWGTDFDTPTLLRFTSNPFTAGWTVEWVGHVTAADVTYDNRILDGNGDVTGWKYNIAPGEVDFPSVQQVLDAIW